MMNRTTAKIVIFSHPFVIEGLDGVQPAGSYIVEVEEELLQALSFPAWRRCYTTIRLARRAGDSATEQVATIDLAALDAALARDVAAGYSPPVEEAASATRDHGWGISNPIVSS